MNRSAVAIALGLLAASAAVAAALFVREPQAPIPVSQAADPADYFDQGAEMEERVRALEAAVAEERNARLLLEEELQALYAEIDELAEESTGRRSEEELAADAAV